MGTDGDFPAELVPPSATACPAEAAASTPTQAARKAWLAREELVVHHQHKQSLVHEVTHHDDPE